LQFNEYNFPIAVAIVLSGMYEDDLDNAEDVVYTGQGGHNLTGDKRQMRDQKLERGNLALKVCILIVIVISCFLVLQLMLSYAIHWKQPLLVSSPIHFVNS
jgi:hypothetical protein